MLLEDGGKVCLGHIIGKGAVPEYHSGINGRFQFLVPVDDSLSERFNGVAINALRQAHQQCPSTNAVHSLAGNCFLFYADG